MTHQGLPVAGYQPQSDVAIQVVNGNKQLEESILRVIDKMMSADEIDKRWLSIGRTHIELAFMAINRAVFQPQRVKLPSDDQ